MPESFEDEPTSTIDLAELWQIARRRFWHFLLPFFAVWIIAVLVSRALPAVYRSGTLILVEEPTVPQQYVVPNVSGELQNRLDSITQQILSRTRLLRIVQKLDLYSADRTRLTTDDLIDRMKKNISIELVRAPGRDELTAFNIYFSSTNPHTAQDVTSELTNLFISENLEVRQQQSESTTQFLESQLADARTTLAQQEERVREYKNRYLGELPGQLESNIQILSGLQNQLQAEEDALGRAKQQNAYFESLLTQYRNAQASTAGPGNIPTGLPAIEQELGLLRAQLADLRSRYTEDYPDVRKLRDKIAKTENLRKEIIAELKAKAETQKSDSGAAGSEYVGTNQISPMIEVQGQLKANQIEIANRQDAIKDLQTRIAGYQARLNQTPVREQQLADLSRDYEQSKANYDSLLAKKNQSALATNLERRQEGEHFRILDPPSLPTKPYFPNRLKFAGVGLFLGLVMGTASIIGAEKIDDRIYSQQQLKDVLPAEIIVQIPPLLTPKEHSRKRTRAFLRAFAAAMVVICVAAGMVGTYLHG